MVLYDDNGISIDGETKGWFTDDTPRRFEAYGWNVIRDVDGHDVAAVDRAIARRGRRVTDRPTLICCKTVIGKGAPNKAGTAEAHGAALGEKEVARDARRARLDASAVRDSRRDLRRLECARARRVGRGCVGEALRARIARRIPALAAEFTRRMHGELPATWRETASAFVAAQAAKGETVATRKASQQAIEALRQGAAGD